MRIALSAIPLLSSSRATQLTSIAVGAAGQAMATAAAFARPAVMRAVVAADGACLLESRPLPTLKEGEALVRVHYSAINRADTLQRKGLYPPPPGESDVLGLELTGEVVEVSGGGGAEGIKVGSRVMALVAGGGNAEFCAVNTRHLLPVPPALEFRTAAAIPEVWLTAFQLLHIVGRLEPSDSVLIHAAGSGVGTAAVQLARLAGAATIIAVAGDDEKLRVVRDLGAHHTINYKTHPTFSQQVMDATGGAGATLILDPVGGSFWRENAAAAAQDARWVLYGSMGGGSVEGGLFAQILRKRIQLLGTTLRARNTAYKADLVERFRETALPGLASGALRPVIDSEFSLDDIGAAHARLESNATTGKVILRVM